jgi:hypothetical protein
MRYKDGGKLSAEEARIWKELVVACFWLQSCQPPGETEKDHEKHEPGYEKIVTLPLFETGIPKNWG